MEVCTIINLLALASEISGHKLGDIDAKASEEDFNLLVENIFEKINLLEKWEESAEAEEDDEEGEEESEEEEGDEEGDEGSAEEDLEDEEESVDGEEEEDEMLKFYYG